MNLLRTCISQTNESYVKESLTNNSFALIPGEDEVEVVVAAAREVADPKGFLSMKAITKLLLPEEKEERWDTAPHLIVHSSLLPSLKSSVPWVYPISSLS